MHARSVTCFAAALGVTWATLAPGSSGAIEDVNMTTTITVQDGHIVAHWSTGGFDHYNVRWSENGGAETQVERAGDKRFVFLTTFRRGAVYTVKVQGCETHFAGRSSCTSWDEAQCGPGHGSCR